MKGNSAIRQDSPVQSPLNHCPGTSPASFEGDEGSPVQVRTWTQGICPNCGETGADIDPDGLLWCPACGYSKKGRYT